MRRIACALLAGFVLSGTAQTPAPVMAGPAPHAEVEILPGWRQPDGSHIAALRIQLDTGWKTYWRAPGEAGIPPRFDWSGTQNLDAIRFHWPVPEIIVSNGITTLGYSGELLLPFEVVPEDPEGDVIIDGSLDFGICEDICMPLQMPVSGVLPATGGAQNPRILGALAARPDTAQEAAVSAVDCEVETIADGVRVRARIGVAPVGPHEVVVIEPDNAAIWVSSAMVRREADILFAEADLVPPEAQPFALDPETLRITVLAEGRGVDIQGCAERH